MIVLRHVDPKPTKPGLYQIQTELSSIFIIFICDRGIKNDKTFSFYKAASRRIEKYLFSFDLMLVQFPNA